MFAPKELPPAPHPSFSLRLGFSKHAYVDAFKETELRFAVTAVGGTEGALASAAAAATLRSQTDHVKTVQCPDPAAAEEERH